jgi:hypothetical protein
MGSVILEFDNPAGEVGLPTEGAKQLTFLDFLQRELSGFCRRLLFPAFTITLAMLDANPLR